MDNANYNMIDKFIEAVSKLNSFEDCYTFFEGICSDDEIDSMAQRLEVAKQLLENNVYSDIVTDTNASAFIVNRIDKQLKSGGLKRVVEKIVDSDYSESYGAFSYIYDRLTKNINYPARVEYIEDIFQRFGKKPSLVLDLACGTGSASVLLAQNGYEVIGVDGSEEMLDVATKKAKETDKDILFICQQMQEFELYGTVDAVVCLLDSLNYLTDFADLKKTFKLVNNYLNPGGVFIFDINTRHLLKNILPETPIVDTEDEDVLYTWESFYDDEQNICEFVLDFFVKKDGLYDRFTEVHQQKAYTSANIKSALANAGLRLVGEFEDLSFNLPSKNSTKVFYVAVKE